jgi:hypothetical protein
VGAGPQTPNPQPPIPNPQSPTLKPKTLRIMSHHTRYYEIWLFKFDLISGVFSEGILKEDYANFIS